MKVSMRREAFTLIELLVVIAIMAILMGLLLGAVQKVRDTANNMQSMNNLRNIGTAVTNCATQNKDKLPPGWGSFRSSPVMTGFMHLMPYLDQENIYRDYISSYNNPANSANALGAAMSAAGSVPFKGLHANADVSIDPSTSQVSYSLNAVLFPGATGQGTNLTASAGSGVSSSFKLGKDLVNGSGNTLIALERSAVCAGGIIHNFNGSGITGGVQARMVMGPVNTSVITQLVPASQIRPAKNIADDNYVQGFASSGFHAVMADASAKNISLNVQPAVFNAVCNFNVSPSGGSSIFASWDD
jgi:prepilin-type N-terminal cleavage/methylation domain-containing protein